jgi:polysaccharide pyruvyl transferase WcaK-like protein
MGHPDLDDQIMEPQVSTVSELLSAISRTDMVIASRFHSVLLSSLLHKPIIAISFDVKVRSLMENLQLSEYILDIHNFDLSSLALRFRNLEEKRDAVSAQLMASVSDYRAALESEYSQVFNGHLVHDRSK